MLTILFALSRAMSYEYMLTLLHDIFASDLATLHSVHKEIFSGYGYMEFYTNKFNVPLCYYFYWHWIGFYMTVYKKSVGYSRKDLYIATDKGLLKRIIMHCGVVSIQDVEHIM